MGLGTSRLRLSFDARLSLGFPSVGSLHSFLEYSLPYSLLGNNSNILGKLQALPSEVSERILEGILKMASEKLRLEFQNPPDLSSDINGKLGHRGGQEV